MIASNANEKKLERVCFVTTGATAEFRELIEALFKPDVLELLVKEGFTKLHVQCGATLKDIHSLLPPDLEAPLKIRCYDFKKNGLREDMLECQERKGIRQRGIVIMHAGTYGRVEGIPISRSIPSSISSPISSSMAVLQNRLTCFSGTGTVMEAMRLGLTYVVVPNTSLLNNHQDELANELHVLNIATRATTR